mmetsp:Transcript_18144/g.43631  ORF Transcript_18144/g.43631 Transcript_18144/m.43631 type:complete len:366 (-) Transcript_18144:1072-2169(-)
MTKKRKRHSKNPDMGKCVKAFDAHVERNQKRALDLRAWHKKEKICETYKIPYKSFWKYARSEKALRWKTKQQMKESKDERDWQAMENHNKNIARGDLPLILLQEFQRRMQEKSIRRRQLQFQRMQCDYKKAHLDLRFGHKYWKEHLPLYCEMLEKDTAFLERERDLLISCHKTFGSHLVQYIGPGVDEKGEDDGRDITKGRRDQIEKKLNLFRLFQTRHALSAKKSRVSIPCLSVAIDVFLEKFEDGVEARGLERPNLRAQFREANYSCSQELKRKKRDIRKVKEEPDAYEKILDLGIPEKPKCELMRKMKSIIEYEHRAEDDALALAEANLPALRKTILICAKHSLRMTKTGPRFTRSYEKISA